MFLTSPLRLRHLAGVCLLLAGPGGASAAAPPPSRQWLELTETLVSAAKPGPPDAARIYAYAATAYRDALQGTRSSTQAGEATRQVLHLIFPGPGTGIDRDAPTRLAADQTIAPEAVAVVVALKRRLARDGRAADDPARAWRRAPKGAGHWVRALPGTPANPTAGTWRRWVIEGITFSVPSPPTFGSPTYREQLAAVHAAVARRDANWSRIIDFWAGVPGTHTPSGIWQDRLFAEAGSSLGMRDAAYASAQAALAQGLSDAFDECWKVKYRWWTARPSMVDPSLPLAMKNPPFPAYVSGHSTVSAAAAEILSAVVPSKTAVWKRDAAEARDSRLYAGIHFPLDNSAGFALGRSVGTAVVIRLALTSLETRR